MNIRLRQIVAFIAGFILSYSILNAAVPTATTPTIGNKGSVMPSEAKGSSLNSRVVVRNSRPSESETATTPQPKRNTTSMQPNAGRPAEVNRATATKQPAGTTPTVKAPNSGVPKYPEPNTVAPKPSVSKQPTGSTPTVKRTTESKQPVSGTPAVSRPAEGVPSYPLPNGVAR